MTAPTEPTRVGVAVRLCPEACSRSDAQTVGGGARDAQAGTPLQVRQGRTRLLYHAVLQEDADACGTQSTTSQPLLRPPARPPTPPRSPPLRILLAPPSPFVSPKLVHQPHSNLFVSSVCVLSPAVCLRPSLPPSLSLSLSLSPSPSLLPSLSSMRFPLPRIHLPVTCA